MRQYPWPARMNCILTGTGELETLPLITQDDAIRDNRFNTRSTLYQTALKVFMVVDEKYPLRLLRRIDMDCHRHRRNGALYFRRHLLQQRSVVRFQKHSGAVSP